MRRLAFVCTLALLAPGLVCAGAKREQPFHFNHDIAPHLARSGCAAAECHGGATGRGGFKLSLFATNGRADFEAIAQDLDGRRVDFSSPRDSLLLLKPTRQMKHRGGKVIEKESDAYRAKATETLQ